MDLGMIYPAVLTLVLIGVLLGVGITVLDKLGASSGLTAGGGAAINTTRDAIADFAGWLGIIVVIIAAALIISLVITSFNRQR